MKQAHLSPHLCIFYLQNSRKFKHFDNKLFFPFKWSAGSTSWEAWRRMKPSRNFSTSPSNGKWISSIWNQNFGEKIFVKDLKKYRAHQLILFENIINKIKKNNFIFPAWPQRSCFTWSIWLLTTFASERQSRSSWVHWERQLWRRRRGELISRQSLQSTDPSQRNWQRRNRCFILSIHFENRFCWLTEYLVS